MKTASKKQISDIVATAARAKQAGYDGVEIMGSEGYFLNQFPRDPHQQAHGPLGAGPMKTGCACQSRWCAARAKRWGRISSSFTACP